MSAILTTLESVGDYLADVNTATGRLSTITQVRYKSDILLNLQIGIASNWLVTQDIVTNNGYWWYDGNNLFYSGTANTVTLSTSNTAAQNTALIQAALNNSGNVYIVGNGSFQITSTLVIYPNTAITLSKNLTLQRPPTDSTGFPIFKNVNWGSPYAIITSLQIIADSSGILQAGQLVQATMSVLPASYVPGAYVHVVGAVASALQTVLNMAVLPTANDTVTIGTDTYTFVASGATGKQVNIGASTNATINNLITVIGTAGNGLYTASNINGISALVSCTTPGTPSSSLTTARSNSGSINWRDSALIGDVNTNNADVYNGVWKIISTNPGANTFTYAIGDINTAFGAPSPAVYSPANVNADYYLSGITVGGVLYGVGGIQTALADSNISLSGGTIDGNMTNPQHGNDYTVFTNHFRKVANLTITDQIVINSRDGYVLDHIYHEKVDVKGYNCGSIVQHTGGGRDHNVTVGGNCADDMVSYLLGDYPTFSSPANGTYVGDFDAISIPRIYCENGFRAVHTVGQRYHKHRKLTIGDVNGKFAIAGAGFSIGDDTGCSSMTTSGSNPAGYSSVGQFRMDKLQLSDYSEQTVVQLGAIFDALSIGCLQIAVGQTSQSVGLSLLTTAQAGSFMIDTLELYSGSGYYSPNGFGVQNASNIQHIQIGKLVLKNLSAPWVQATGVASSNTISIGDVSSVNCGQTFVMNNGSGTVLNIGNATRLGYQATPFINANVALTLNSLLASNMNSPDMIGGSGTITIGNCPGLGVDVGQTGISRTPGALCRYRLNGTARGTLVDNNLVICNDTGASGSWQQLSNTVSGTVQKY